MIIFPKSTEINKPMPKEAFYRNLALSTGIKEKFVSDIKRIVLLNKLAPTTFNITKGKDIGEILVLSVELKKQDLDYKTIETIARKNKHKILFIIKFEESAQLAIFHNKLYKNHWRQAQNQNLAVTGMNLDDVWKNFVAQISGIEIGLGEDLDEKIEKHEQTERLKKEISRLEKLVQNEKTPKKKFELVVELQGMKKELDVAK